MKRGRRAPGKIAQVIAPQTMSTTNQNLGMSAFGRQARKPGDAEERDRDRQLGDEVSGTNEIATTKSSPQA